MEYRFSAIRNGVEHVKRVEIPDRELEPPYFMYERAKELYRKNTIIKHLNKWALSLFELSYEEVTTHENNSNRPHHSLTQPKAEETADEGGLQA